MTVKCVGSKDTADNQRRVLVSDLPWASRAGMCFYCTNIVASGADNKGWL